MGNEAVRQNEMQETEERNELNLLYLRGKADKALWGIRGLLRAKGTADSVRTECRLLRLEIAARLADVVRSFSEHLGSEWDPLDKSSKDYAAGYDLLRACCQVNCRLAEGRPDPVPEGVNRADWLKAELARRGEPERPALAGTGRAQLRQALSEAFPDFPDTVEN